MLFGVFEELDPDAGPAKITVGAANLGPLPMGNGLTRLQTRFLGDPDGLAAAEKAAEEPLEAEEAEKLGLVTFAPDDIDWEEEVRIAVEERASFSPDALTGLEAELPVRRARDDRDEDLRAADRLAELDFLPPERLGPGRRAARLRTGQAG